ncbi:hypothetical protein AB1Y20_016679 [Prymnesium parvum]|uniref:Uncharacterized protein n=1 Tax=Prymnesium parvum TaxID=97485 RepID=A0AB34IDP4_PRYPA
MVAQHGGDSGPSCWDWIGKNLLGGRDEQEVLSYLLNQLRYDGSRTVTMSFFSEFHTLASAIIPAIPDGRLCTMYASMKFPAREYISIVSACDTTPGHGNFMNFANAVNAAIQRWHQRLLNERRDGHGHDALMTNFDKDDDDDFEAYVTDSTTFHRPDDPPFTYNEVDDMADQLYQAIDLYLVRKGNGSNRGGNHWSRRPHRQPHPPQSPGVKPPNK